MGTCIICNKRKTTAGYDKCYTCANIVKSTAVVTGGGCQVCNGSKCKTVKFEKNLHLEHLKQSKQQETINICFLCFDKLHRKGLAFSPMKQATWTKTDIAKAVALNGWLEALFYEEKEQADRYLEIYRNDGVEKIDFDNNGDVIEY
jgi:hypothetical protein